MSAWARTFGPAFVRQRAMSAALVSLAAALVFFVPAPQAALAASRGVSSISAGGEHACAIINGIGYCWGEDFNGELGNGTSTNSGVPVAIDSGGALAGKVLTQISSGYEHTCALDAAGAAYCWGLNSYGQLGDGTTTSTTVPVAVDTNGVLAGKTLTQITSGVVATCALDSAGAAFCWGFNAYGQIGDGEKSPFSTVPVAVDTNGVLAGKTLTQIMSGYEETCALDSAGAAYCWGRDSYGQLGDGSNANSSVPVAVNSTGALAGRALTQIAVSWYHACAVDAVGTAFCWGRDSYGQLGDGSVTDSNVPEAVDAGGVLAGKALTQVVAGAFDTCALDSAGAAYCWGYDHYGELGDASTTSSSVPVAVDTGGALAGKTLTQITIGDYHTCAVDAAGAAYCWGRDTVGELGDDGLGDDGFGGRSSVPVLVGL